MPSVRDQLTRRFRFPAIISFESIALLLLRKSYGMFT